MENLSKVLLVVAILSVVVAGVNVFMVTLAVPTGFASVEQGNATLNIQATASINFTNRLIDWGTGSVNNTCNSATLITNGTNTPNCAIGWNAVSRGLVLENIGNTNVNVNLTTSSNATTFIGGTADGGPVYQWLLNYDSADGDGESLSCVSGFADNVTYANVPNLPGDGRIVCGNFSYLDAADEFEIDLKITIPQDASVGSRFSLITATATAI